MFCKPCGRNTWSAITFEYQYLQHIKDVNSLYTLIGHVHGKIISFIWQHDLIYYMFVRVAIVLELNYVSF